VENEESKEIRSGIIYTVPNAITLFRFVAVIPLIYYIYKEGSNYPAFFWWIAVGVSDFFDGWLARRRGGGTASGAFLDPLVDKVVSLSGLYVFVFRGYYWWFPVTLMALREVGISILRVYYSKQSISLPARSLGKYKTVIQLTAVGFVLFPLFENLRWLNLGMLWLAVLLSLGSGVDMLYHGFQKRKSAR
jgi:CDP-diacylglycerol--glycerol-3-phosphate 3-phosphatidyltransferase